MNVKIARGTGRKWVARAIKPNKNAIICAVPPKRSANPVSMIIHRATSVRPEKAIPVIGLPATAAIVHYRMAFGAVWKLIREQAPPFQTGNVNVLLLFGPAVIVMDVAAG